MFFNDFVQIAYRERSQRLLVEVVPQDDLVCGWGPGLDGGAVREDFSAELDLGGGDDLALAGPVEDFQDVAVFGDAPTEVHAELGLRGKLAVAEADRRLSVLA